MQFIDVMVDLAWKNYSNQINRYKDIDTKAMWTISITGVLITLLADHAKSAVTGKLSFFLLLMAFLSFIITITLSFMVIRVQTAKVIRSEEVFNDIKDKEQNYQTYEILKKITECESAMLDKCKEKAVILSKAVLALSSSVILLIVYSFSIFI